MWIWRIFDALPRINQELCIAEKPDVQENVLSVKRKPWKILHDFNSDSKMRLTPAEKQLYAAAFVLNL